MTACPECSGTSFTKGQFELAQVIERRPVVLRNIPALECSQCGNLVISADVSAEIDTALAEGRPTDKVFAHVYDLAVLRDARLHPEASTSAEAPSIRSPEHSLTPRSSA